MNKAKTISLLVACGIVLVFTACGLVDGDPKKQLPENLIPLAVGNYWDYHRWFISHNMADTIREEVLSKHIFLIDGKEQNVFGYQQFYQQQHKNKITPDTSLLVFGENKQSPSPPRYKNKLDVPNYQWLRANGEDGLLSFGGISPTDTLLLKSTQYRYPTQTGEQHEFSTLSYSFSKLQFSVQDTIAIETIGTNETFESEWATYKGCYMYRFQEIGKDDAMYIWDHYVYMKPGIGIVAIETIQLTSDIPNDLVGQWVLIDYQLNN